MSRGLMSPRWANLYHRSRWPGVRLALVGFVGDELVGFEVMTRFVSLGFWPTQKFHQVLFWNKLRKHITKTVCQEAISL